MAVNKPPNGSLAARAARRKLLRYEGMAIMSFETFQTPDDEVLVGVFDDASCGRHAAAELRDMGLRPWQIGRAVRDGELTEACGALGTIDVPEHNLMGGLIALGVPVEPARAYASEFERNRTIVTVHGMDHLGPAARVLQRAGARSALTWSAHRIRHAADQ